jgi:hypothetical protein
MWSSLLMDNSNYVTAEILVLTPAVVRLSALALGIAAIGFGPIVISQAGAERNQASRLGHN